MATVLSRRPPDEFDAVREQLMPAMIAYSSVHREFGEAWRHRVMEPKRACLRRVLRRGIKRHLLPAALDLEAAMGLLLGPLLYGSIFYKGAAKRPYDFGRLAAESFWRAHRVEGESAGKARRSKSSAG